MLPARLEPAAAFQSTCPARGTTKMAIGGDAMENISIHVPREGHDAGISGTRQTF